MNRHRLYTHRGFDCFLPLSPCILKIFCHQEVLIPLLVLNLDFARDSIFLPQRRHNRSGIRRRFIFVAHILLLIQYRSSSITRCPFWFNCLMTAFTYLLFDSKNLSLQPRIICKPIPYDSCRLCEPSCLAHTTAHNGFSLFGRARGLLFARQKSHDRRPGVYL